MWLYLVEKVQKQTGVHCQLAVQTLMIALLTYIYQVMQLQKTCALRNTCSTHQCLQHLIDFWASCHHWAKKQQPHDTVYLLVTMNFPKHAHILNHTDTHMVRIPPVKSVVLVCHLRYKSYVTCMSNQNSYRLFSHSLFQAGRLVWIFDPQFPKQDACSKHIEHKVMACQLLHFL